MRKLILILLLFVSAVVNGQTPAGYIKANMRFKWTAGIFDSALHVPQYNGTPSGIRNGAWVGDGAVAVDTVNNLFYFRSSGAWHSTSSGSGWLLTGNSGTTSSNFIGTTDNQPLSFRVNNNWAGRIYTNGSVYLGDSAGVNDVQENESNVGIGRFALKNVTVGSGNVASGESALYNLTVGFGNVAGGLETLYNLTAGSYNTASGTQALHHLTTGSNNVGIGTSSGNNAKQKVDAKNQILIGAGTYGTRDSIAVIGANFMKETILRGNLIDSTLSAGAGTKAVRWNSSTGEFTYADTTVGGGGGGSPAGSNKQVQYNNSGSFGGAAGFEYQSGSSPNVTITGQNAAHVPLYVKGIGSTQTADLFRVMRYDDSAMFRIAANGSVTIGPAFDYVNAIHPPGHEFRYSNSGYTGGIKIRNHNSGSEVRLHTINNGLYITDNGGTAAPMTLGTRTNPADASTFIAALGVWTISAGRLGIGGTAHASAQLDASSTTKGFLPPRMTGTQAEAISSPAEGLMVYATDGSGSTITSKGWWGYDGSTWVKLN